MIKIVNRQVSCLTDDDDDEEEELKAAKLRSMSRSAHDMASITLPLRLRLHLT